MLHKTFDILEAKADSEAGTFEALVAVFGNVDKIGDRIMPGAFKDTLAEWKASGDPIPVILSHQWDNPMAHIGVVTDARETGKGLHVKGTLDVQDNDVAKQVHRLMKRRSLKEFSFGYSVPAGGERRAKDGANELLKVDLAEVGPTLKGMNPATELHAVKSALDEKASGMAGVLERMAALVDRQEAPTEAEVLALARYIQGQFSEPAKSVPAVEGDGTVSSEADGTDKEKDSRGSGSRSVDTLEKQARTVAMGVLFDGSKPPEKAPETPKPYPDIDPAELKAQARALMVQVLSN